MPNLLWLLIFSAVSELVAGNQFRWIWPRETSDDLPPTTVDSEDLGPPGGLPHTTSSSEYKNDIPFDQSQNDRRPDKKDPEDLFSDAYEPSKPKIVQEREEVKTPEAYHPEKTKPEEVVQEESDKQGGGEGNPDAGKDNPRLPISDVMGSLKYPSLSWAPPPSWTLPPTSWTPLRTIQIQIPAPNKSGQSDTDDGDEKLGLGIYNQIIHKLQPKNNQNMRDEENMKKDEPTIAKDKHNHQRDPNNSFFGRFFENFRFLMSL